MKLEFAKSINVIKNFFRITYLKNTGAAFSILSGNIIFLILITLIALFLIYFFLIRNKELKKIEIISYGMLIGGVIGNLIDRIRLGYVVDYLDFNFGNYNYPVFNFADTLIVISVILIIISTGSDKDGNKSR
jgi:signal peptidase II